MTRGLLLRIVLLLYAAGTVVIAIPLAFALGNTGELADTTSGKILAAALVSLGLGALVASRDPRRHRVVVQMLIVFTSLAALAIASRLVSGRHPHDVVWLLLPFAVAAPVLLALLYPRRQDGHVAAREEVGRSGPRDG